MAAGGSYGFYRRPSELITVNDVTTRELAQPQPTSGGDNNQKFFELAEANYPELFPEGLFILTHITSTEFYRYYSATDTFLISRNGVVSARGGKFGAGGVLLLQHILQSRSERVDEGYAYSGYGRSHPVDPVQRAYEEGVRERREAEQRERAARAYECGRWGRSCEEIGY